MSNPFVAEIRLVGFNFAPLGWALCDGQILPISQNTALFSLLGTIYGGNGINNFALPNLQSRTPIGAGQGPGLSLYDLGEETGSETVTLQTTEMPSHTHGLQGTTTTATTTDPTGNLFAVTNATSRINKLYANSANTTPMAATVLSAAGGSLPHNNLQPYLTMNYIIALQGIFPARS